MAEKKYFNTIINVTAIGATNIGALSLVTQGADTNQRIGTRTLGTSLEVIWQIRPPTPDGANAGYTRTPGYRLVFFIWKDDTAPTKTTLFDGFPIGTSFHLNAQRPFNKEYQVKRKILWNNYYVAQFDFDDTLQSYENVNNLPFYGRFVIPLTKLKNKLNEINFNPGATAGTNHLYYAFLTDEEPGAPPYVTSFLTLFSRYNFVDF